MNKVKRHILSFQIRILLKLTFRIVMRSQPIVPMISIWILIPTPCWGSIPIPITWNLPDSETRYQLISSGTFNLSIDISSKRCDVSFSENLIGGGGCGVCIYVDGGGGGCACSGIWCAYVVVVVCFYCCCWGVGIVLIFGVIFMFGVVFIFGVLFLLVSFWGCFNFDIIF